MTNSDSIDLLYLYIFKKDFLRYLLSLTELNMSSGLFLFLQAEQGYETVNLARAQCFSHSWYKMLLPSLLLLVSRKLLCIVKHACSFNGHYITYSLVVRKYNRLFCQMLFYRGILSSLAVFFVASLTLFRFPSALLCCSKTCVSAAVAFCCCHQKAMF